MILIYNEIKSYTKKILGRVQNIIIK